MAQWGTHVHQTPRLGKQLENTKADLLHADIACLEIGLSY